MGPQHFPDRMVSRPPAPPGRPAEEWPRQRKAMPFEIVIPSSDGTVLLRMTEDEHGRLSVTGDESRWDEGATRFLHQMMQWSGVVGVGWKERVTEGMQGMIV